LGGVAGTSGSDLSVEEGRYVRDRAMHTLRRAVAAGHCRFEWMRRDPDLDPLRRRRDFQLLMMDVEFPGEPFARRD